jgi:hypothetical protein
VVRVEPDEEKGPIVFMGAEFYPPAEPERPPEPQMKRKRTRSSPSWKGSLRC